MNKIANQVLKNFLDENKKIKLPDWCKRVSIDVGTSINAPNSEHWLSTDSELCVFAFEPNPFNVNHLKSGEKIWPIHLNPQRIGNSFFIVECALSKGEPRFSEFYCTEGDSGTSSMFKPSYFNVKELVKVPTISLKDFFDFFDWEKVEYIEHLKIDAQSSDFDIVQGSGSYLNERVLYLTVESTTNTQYLNQENPEKMKEYIENLGFYCDHWGQNGRFLNTNFKNLWNNIEYKFLEPD
jgi:FkbM family methyltransferase